MIASRTLHRRGLRLLLLCSLVSAAPVFAQDEPSIEVTFSPEGGATEAIIHLIEDAQTSIRLAAYSFTSRPIAEALAEAHKRGVDVRAVLDASNETDRFTVANILAEADVPIRADHRYAAMHNKFLVIDGADVETGSFNYTRSAEKHNAENAMILRGYPKVAGEYQNRWQVLWDESETFRPSR